LLIDPCEKQKKEKEPKRKKSSKGEGLWKLTPTVEIRRNGFPQWLEKDFAMNAQLFHSSAQARRSTNQREF
jgi:hypothetical protein